MRPVLTSLFAIAFAAATTLATPTPSDAKNKDAAAAVVGAIIGVAIGAALADKHRKPEDRMWQGGRARSFSPKPGVVCYARMGECYKNGRYSPSWTLEIYGYQ